MSLSKEIRCHRDTETNYVNILEAISCKKKTIIDISKDIGLSDDNTQRMIKKLQKNGYVKKAFAGKYRYVSLTEIGKNAITNCIQ